MVTGCPVAAIVPANPWPNGILTPFDFFLDAFRRSSDELGLHQVQEEDGCGVGGESLSDTDQKLVQ